MERRSLLIKTFVTALAYVGISRHSEAETNVSKNNSDNNVKDLSSQSSLIGELKTQLSAPTGLALIGQCISIQELRKTIPVVDGQRISVKGYYADSNEGGGVFYYDAKDNKSEDNGGNIIIASGKRWKREEHYLMEPEFFGAKGDGVSDDTDSLQRALDASINKVLIFAPKKYRSKNLVINGALIIKGAGRRIDAAIIPLDDTVGNFITIDSPESPTFYDLTISAKNVKIDSHLTGLYISSNKTKEYAPSVLMYNCNINSFTGNCIYADHGRHMGVLDNCQLEYSTEDCLVINGVDWNISHCAIGYTKKGNGIVITQPTNRIANSDIYFNKKNGIVLNNNSINGYIANNVINSNGENGIIISSNSHVKQGHIIVNNFFFNNSKSNSGVSSNIFLTNNIKGVGISGNSHFTYTDTSQRPRYLLCLGEGAVGSLIGDSFNVNSYVESPINTPSSTIINNEQVTIGSQSMLSRSVSDGSEYPAFLIENVEGRKKLLEISNRGEILFYDINGKELTVGSDKTETNTLTFNCNLSIIKNNSSDLEFSYLKLGGFYIWDDLNGNLKVDNKKPESKHAGSILFQAK
ncbi:right-handed parallel beta-helix repeat-containing protein [Raoultella terrigena]|uniref:Pectate lyase superfamily protein n=1 Tax=Raoultella terrigena TaxID=577 RepID=A0A7Z8Z877_RAOTE|nr:Uncharacterised protein [Raoultella terrigena]